MVRWIFQGIQFEGSSDDALAFARGATLLSQPIAAVRAPVIPPTAASTSRERPNRFYIGDVACWTIAGPDKSNPHRWKWRARDKYGAKNREVWHGWATPEEARQKIAEALASRTPAERTDRLIEKVVTSAMVPPPAHLPSGAIYAALSNAPMTTMEIAKKVSIPQHRVHDLLIRLKKSGFVRQHSMVRSAVGIDGMDMTWVREPIKSESCKAEAPERRTTRKETILGALTSSWQSASQIAGATRCPSDTVSTYLSYYAKRGEIERFKEDGCRIKYRLKAA